MDVFPVTDWYWHGGYIAPSLSVYRKYVEGSYYPCNFRDSVSWDMPGFAKHASLNVFAGTATLKIVLLKDFYSSEESIAAILCLLNFPGLLWECISCDHCSPLTLFFCVETD